MKNIFVIYLLFFTSILFAQTPPHIQDAKRGFTWNSGYGSFGDIRGGRTEEYLPPFSMQRFDAYVDLRANAIISDTSGQLLFYTNGIHIADKNKNIMLGSQILNPGYWADNYFAGYKPIKGVLVLPQPNNDSLYYVFHNRYYDNAAANDSLEGSYYTIVNIKRNNGLGEVVSLRNPITQNARIGRSINACRHANGRDWWVIIKRCHGDEYLPILLDPTGVHSQGWQPNILPRYSPFAYNNFTGHDMFSPDGKWFVVNNMSAIGNCVSVYPFDRCTGRMSVPLLYNWNDSTYAAAGCTFSENSKYLYINSSKYIFQCDMTNPNPFARIDTIATDDGSLGNYPNYNASFGLPQLASNGKIYMTPFGGTTRYYHVINNPNVAAPNTDFVQRGVELLTINLSSIPNIPYFCLGPLDGSPCDTLGIDNIDTTFTTKTPEINPIKVFPNPAKDILNIEIENKDVSLSYKIYDMLGRQVQDGALNNGLTINIKTLTNGVYFLSISDKNGGVYRAVRFVVQRE